MNHTRLSIFFKEWFNLNEVINPETETALRFQKHVDPQNLDDFINYLKNSPETYDKSTAFRLLLNKYPKTSEKSQEIPKDPFLQNYYNLLQNNKISKAEYNVVKYFAEKNINQNLLKSIMDSLRKLIQEGKIDLNLANNIPTIINKKTNQVFKSTDFTTFSGYIHAIETQDITQTSDPNLADPVFLEISHKERLVAKSQDGKIWVFKATSPLECRAMGKGQGWCIASSSSTKWYFHYRHEYGQTQYFIFDFNKDKNDPARYVNPGVAPEDEYSEWVDSNNDVEEDENGNGFGINGYATLEDYLQYLEKNGIPKNTFKADPITKEEESLKNLIDDYNDGSKQKRNNTFEEVKENPDLINQFLQLIERYLDEDHFNQLSDRQKKLYISDIDDETLSYFLYHATNRDKIIEEILKYKGNNLSDENVEALIARTKDLSKTIKEILDYKGENLSAKNISVIRYYSSNLEKDESDEITNKIIKYKGNNLSDENVHDFLLDSLEPDKIAKEIIKYKSDLSADDIYCLLRYSRNIDEIADMIGKEKINKLHARHITALLDRLRGPRFEKIANAIIIKYINYYAISDDMMKIIFANANNKYEMAEKIINKIPNPSIELSPELIKYFLDGADDRYKMAKLIIAKAPEAYQSYKANKEPSFDKE